MAGECLEPAAQIPLTHQLPLIGIPAHPSEEEAGSPCDLSEPPGKPQRPRGRAVHTSTDICMREETSASQL